MSTGGSVSSSKPVALVTGASYGVGAATALVLAREGFDLAISATRLSNLDATAKALQATGCRIAKVELDLCSQSSIDGAINAVIDTYGRLDVLVNNAAVNLRKAALDVTPEEWDAVLRANTTGTFFITQAFARHRIKAAQPGCVVNVSSTVMPNTCRPCWTASPCTGWRRPRMLQKRWRIWPVRAADLSPGIQWLSMAA
jgi:3-oxoacyl-[acyl-carrier protein] reductase